VNLKNNPIYQQYKPAAGSRLYLALEAHMAAQTPVDEMYTTLDDLKKKRQAAADTLAGVDWSSDLEPAIRAAAQTPVLDVMLQKAEGELRTRLRAAQATGKELNNLTTGLKDAQAEHDRHANNLIRTNGMIAAGDKFPPDTVEALKVRLAKAEQALERTKTAYLTAV
jgi:hypothetical protein